MESLVEQLSRPARAGGGTGAGAQTCTRLETRDAREQEQRLGSVWRRRTVVAWIARAAGRPGRLRVVAAAPGSRRPRLEPAAGTEKKQRKGRAREGDGDGERERERELGGGGELGGDKKRDERLTGRGQHPTW